MVRIKGQKRGFIMSTEVIGKLKEAKRSYEELLSVQEQSIRENQIQQENELANKKELESKFEEKQKDMMDIEEIPRKLKYEKQEAIKSILKWFVIALVGIGVFTAIFYPDNVDITPLIVIIVIIIAILIGIVMHFTKRYRGDNELSLKKMKEIKSNNISVETMRVEIEKIENALNYSKENINKINQILMEKQNERTELRKAITELDEQINNTEDELQRITGEIIKIIRPEYIKEGTELHSLAVQLNSLR